MANNWLALMIGNSRAHWALFGGKTLLQTWHSPLKTDNPEFPQLSEHKETLPLYFASVVPTQTARWNAPYSREITLADLPLKGIYATLGIDRALALWGAGVTYGFPCLVIDGGTALTITGADSCELVGGAILPGLGVQLQSLSQKTAALPEVRLPTELPQRWALETPEAIQSGVIYTILAGIKDFMADWWGQFPHSPIILTGGDAALLLHYLQSFPDAPQVTVDANLIFWGMRASVDQL